jgi:UDP-N-acetylmuramate dehydrogenase
VSGPAPGGPHDPVAAIDELAGALGPLAERDVPLGPLTTYRAGGPASVLVHVHDDDAVGRVAAALRGHPVPVLVVGKGSNLLVADAGFAGLAVVLGEGFASVEVVGTTVRAGAAAALPVVARQSVRAGLTGFEWAVGVPGSIGGAVRMNAGGHGSDLAANLRRVRVLDLLGGEDEEVDAADLDLGYRRSNLRAHQLVLRADLELAPGDRVAGEAELAEIVRWRRANQPGGANAGSVFTNPPGDSAGRLIDAAGLKGRRVGSASVSTKHANFIQVDPGGSADDVRRLMAEVVDRVEATSGVVLHAETHVVGFDPVEDGRR